MKTMGRKGILVRKPEGSLVSKKNTANGYYFSHLATMVSIAQNAPTETQSFTRNLRSFLFLCDNMTTEKNDGFVAFIASTPAFENGSGATGPLSFAPSKMKRHTAFQSHKLIKSLLNIPGKQKHKPQRLPILSGFHSAGYSPFAPVASLT